MPATNLNLSCIPESNERRIVKEIQDRESMAEVVGCVYELLSLLLQDTRGMNLDCVSIPRGRSLHKVNYVSALSFTTNLKELLQNN